MIRPCEHAKIQTSEKGILQHTKDKETSRLLVLQSRRVGSQRHYGENRNIGIEAFLSSVLFMGVRVPSYINDFLVLAASPLGPSPFALPPEAARFFFSCIDVRIDTVKADPLVVFRPARSDLDDHAFRGVGTPNFSSARLPLATPFPVLSVSLAFRSQALWHCRPHTPFHCCSILSACFSMYMCFVRFICPSRSHYLTGKTKERALLIRKTVRAILFA